MTEPIAYASPEDAAKMENKKKNRKRKRGSKPSESNTTGTEESEPQIPNQTDKEDKGEGDWEQHKDDINKRNRLRPQDWILQFDPPDDLMEYLRRVVRRARGECEVGKEFLFLFPEEMRIIRFLEAASIFLRSRVFKVNRKVQAQLEKAVGDNYYLHKSAKEAYKSYLIAYNSHSMKDYFNFDRLDLQGVAASFCVSIPARQR